MLICARYDDGGYSRGSMERPAVQKLLGDLRARRIDVVVVYKVDRLTRSLAGFAKLVELFDGICHTGISCWTFARRACHGHEEDQLHRIPVPARGH
jgi:Resolvase, N terminal domain